MSKHGKDPRLEALEQGRAVTWTVPEGGDLASMRNVLRHGQSLTFEPVVNPQDVQVGDIVYVKWHGSHIMHLVQEIEGEQFLIANSMGKINGWVRVEDILGRVTQISTPEPPPEVPAMLEQLEQAYRGLLERAGGDEQDARRLLSVVDELRWYAARLGAERWDRLPRANKWSFAQNVWYFTRQAGDAVRADSPQPIHYFIDHGKECVGLAAEILALLEYGEAYS
ncbi:MAG: hypothetical protein JW726_10325 [Anaerolineales bacterium]|nr:hypothetical protein [Anaerolineales bacterium]